MSCSRHVSLSFFDVCFVCALSLMFSCACIVLVVRRVCVSFVCGVCVGVGVRRRSRGGSSPYSKVVLWLFVPSILAQAPLGGFLAGAVFPRMGLHLKRPFGSSFNLKISLLSIL